MSGMQVFAGQAVDAVHALGPLAPWAFILIYIVGTIFFISNPLFFLSAGVLFGTPLGFAVVSAASALSAAIVFLAGRHWSRSWLTEKISKNQKLMILDEAVTQRGWILVFLLRFTAVFPFSLLNYALGLSKIRFRDYILASWLGMMPGIFLYVYMGSLAGRTVFAGGPRHVTLVEWIFCALGIAITVGLSLYGALEVKKILRTHKDPKK